MQAEANISVRTDCNSPCLGCTQIWELDSPRLDTTLAWGNSMCVQKREKYTPVLCVLKKKSNSDLFFDLISILKIRPDLILKCSSSDGSFIMNSRYAFCLTLTDWFYGILHAYFEGIFREKIWSRNNLALKGGCSQELEKPFSTVFEMIFLFICKDIKESICL